MREPVGDLAYFALRFQMLEGIDQVDREEEADALAVMFDDLNAEDRGE